MVFNCIEVGPPAVLTAKWNEISIDIGASQSTLQDGPNLDLAGGFAYSSSMHDVDTDPSEPSDPTARRYIYWHAVKDVLELVELSMDHSLAMNQVRIRFVDLPILEGGVNIVEHQDGVIILVATVASVHRFVFPHPNMIHHQPVSPFLRRAPLSIFSRATADNLCDPNHYHILDAQSRLAASGRGGAGPTGGTINLVTCTSWVETSSKNSVFVLSGSNSVLHVIKLLEPPKSGDRSSGSTYINNQSTVVPESDRVITFDLKRYNFMARIWSALPSILNRNNSQESMDDAPALASHPFGDDHLIYSLSRNLKLRVWSFRDQKCLLETNIVQFAMGIGTVNSNLNTTLDVNSSFNASIDTITGGSRSGATAMPVATGRPLVRIARNNATGNMTVATYLEYDKEPQFILFQPKTVENFPGQVQLERIARMGSPPFDDLIDFMLTSHENELWAVGNDGSLDSASPYSIFHQSYEERPKRTDRHSVDTDVPEGGGGGQADADDEDDDDFDVPEDGWTICYVEQMLTSENLNTIIGSIANTNSLTGDRFINEIFCRGRFALHTITRAIRAYGKQFNANTLRLPDLTTVDLANTDPTATMEQLIHEAQRVVEMTVERKGIMQGGQQQLQAKSEEALEKIYSTEWGKILRSCYQCRDVENRVKGIFVANSSRSDKMFGHVSLVKQSNVSFSRPVGDSFDHLILAGDVNDIKHHLDGLRDSVKPKPTKKLLASLESLFRGVLLVSTRLDSKCKEEFEAAFYGQNSAQLTPSECADYLAGQMLALDVDTENVPLKYHLNDLFDNVAELTAALEFCIAQLNLQLTDKQHEELSKISLTNANHNGMSSSIGLLITAESVRQQARLRYNFVRHLLLLEYLLVSLRNSRVASKADGTSKFDIIQLQHIPATIDLCTSYHYLTWVCEMYPLSGSQVGDFSENYTSTAHLAFSELISHIGWSAERMKWLTTDQLALIQPLFIPKSLLYTFLRERGLALAHELARKSGSSNCAQLPKAILQILWPVASFNHLIEYLFVVGKFHPLSIAIQLLDRNKSDLIAKTNPSRLFMLAVCHLMSDQPAEAVTSLLSAIRGIEQDQLLCKLFQIQPRVSEADERGEECESPISADVAYSYFNRIIQVFKCYCLNDQIIRLATAALGYISSGDPAETMEVDTVGHNTHSDYLSSLYTTLFMCHLELGQSCDAHLAMTFIPDPAQRRVCLRQFIVYHHDKNQWNSLIGDFSLAGDLMREFTSIMELRARSSDLSDCIGSSSSSSSSDLDDVKPFSQEDRKRRTSYYEILYALHVKNSNYHRAATMAYELALRLAHETAANRAILEKQMDALQMTINAMELLDDPDLQFIIIPSQAVAADQHEQTAMDTDDENQLVDDSPPAVSLDEIKQEYELIHGRLALIERQVPTHTPTAGGNPSIALSPLSPPELLTLLVAHNLYDHAFRLVDKCGTSSTASVNKEQIFDGLATKYLNAVAGQVRMEEIQEIILDNRTLRCSFIATCHANTAAQRLWFVADHYLENNEHPGQTFAHKIVARRLLASGHSPLPASLVAVYKRRNWIELLRLLITHDQLEEAVTLTVEYLDALSAGVEVGGGGQRVGKLASESEGFMLARPLNPYTPPANVPLHLINELKSILEREAAACEDPTKETEIQTRLRLLNQKLGTFFKTAQQVSNAILRVC